MMVLCYLLDTIRNSTRPQISGRDTIKILPTRKQQTGDPEIIESSKILEFWDFENSRPMGFCSRETLQATESLLEVLWVNQVH